jgi:Holliday junction resolvasome RuvABC endonuclease subunit
MGDFDSSRSLDAGVVSMPEGEYLSGMTFAGVDPGLDGGVGVYCSGSGDYGFIPTPVIKYKKNRKAKTYSRMYDTQNMVRIMEMLAIIQGFVAIEDPFFVNTGSISASTGLARCVGIYEAGCAANRLSHMLIKPHVWMRAMHKGTPSTDTKARSIMAVKRILPGIDLRRTQNCSKEDHNKADAILLALYAARHVLGDERCEAD